jgi:hypothetical protein
MNSHQPTEPWPGHLASFCLKFAAVDFSELLEHPGNLDKHSDL